MKTKVFWAVLVMACLMLVTSCKNKKESAPVVTQPEKEVYTPKHLTKTVEFAGLKTYNYFNAPINAPATAVKVTYEEQPYVAPIVIKYTYANGDSYTYTVPKEFGLWPNEAGKLRILTSKEKTVWLQGQTKAGKFMEMVFFGDPKYNGTKVKPNSYLNPPDGEIKHSK